MELIKPFINTRIELLNNSEPKESIEDVIFTIKSSGENILDSGIYLIPYEGLRNLTDKEKAIEIVINKIDDKSYFDENNIDLDKFNSVIFFSFDCLNLVDNCYVFDLITGSLRLQVFDLNGTLLIDKKLRDGHQIQVERNESGTPKIYYLFFDTETTGLPKNWRAPVTDLNNWPRLVQLAFLAYDEDGNKISSGDYIIKPEGFSIPADASGIHGITTERALREGQPLSSIIQYFETLIVQASYLVAHNMSFDEKIIGAELLRNKMQNSIPSKHKILYNGVYDKLLCN
jgi:hypothetical protein